MGTRAHSYFQTPPQALFWQLDTLTGPVLALMRELGTLTCPVLALRIGCSNLSSSDSLLRTGHPAGQTGRQDGSQPPSHHQDSFPKTCCGHWDSQWLPLPRAGNQAGLYQNPGCFSHESLRNDAFSWILLGVGSSASCLPSPLWISLVEIILDASLFSSTAVFKFF